MHPRAHPLRSRTPSVRRQRGVFDDRRSSFRRNARSPDTRNRRNGLARREAAVALIYRVVEAWSPLGIPGYISRVSRVFTRASLIISSSRLFACLCNIRDEAWKQFSLRRRWLFFFLILTFFRNWTFSTCFNNWTEWKIYPVRTVHLPRAIPPMTIKWILWSSDTIRLHSENI